MIKDLKYVKYHIDNEYKGRIININEDFTAITGYTWDEVKKNKMTIVDLIPSEQQEEYRMTLRKFIEVGEAYLSHAIKCKNGKLITVNCFGEVYKDSETGHSCTKVFVIDVTEQEKAMEELSKKEEQLALQIEKIKILTENVNEIFMDYDIQNDYIEISRFINGEYDIFYKKENYLKSEDTKVILEDVRRFREFYKNENNVNKSAFDFRTNMFSIEYRWYRLVYTKYTNPRTEKDHIIGRIMDIHEEKLATFKGNEIYEDDELTGVYCEKSAEAKINEIISRSMGQENKHTMLLIDIDGMQEVNSSLGYENGDKILKLIGELLCDMFRQNFDIIARVDGDAFIIFIRNTKEINYIEERCYEICNRVKNEISPKIFKNGEKITVSIGVSVTDNKTYSYRGVYKKAEKALQNQKNNGKDGFNF